MAVEAQYHHLFSPQLYKNSMNASEHPIYGNQTPIYNTVVPAAAAAAAAESVEFVSRKRSRDSLFLLGEDVSSQICSHVLDVDRLIAQHVVNARTELSQKRRRFSGQIIAALNESVAKQLKSKDEEIEQLRSLNWAMEERIKHLAIENNAWRYLAQSHEAAAATLRENLDRVLAEQSAAAAAVADDAESCCGGDNCVSVDWRRMCRNCGNGEPSVLLLPCRHMCLCAACGPAIDTCPVCKCSKNGSVNVNLC